MSKKEPTFAKIDTLNDIAKAIFLADQSTEICNINILNNIQNASVLIEKNRDFIGEHDLIRFESEIDSIKRKFIEKCSCLKVSKLVELEKKSMYPFGP